MLRRSLLFSSLPTTSSAAKAFLQTTFKKPTPTPTLLLSSSLTTTSSSSSSLFSSTRLNRQYYTPSDSHKSPSEVDEPENKSTSKKQSQQKQQNEDEEDDENHLLRPSELIRQVDQFEGMPRYPSLTSVMGSMRLLDYVGTTAFAVSGSLLAATYGLNAFGCTCVGVTTALGGGAIRDMVFGTLPVSFIDEYEYVILAMLAAAGTFTLCLLYEPTEKHMHEYEAAMFWLDSIGLGAFCVIATIFGARRELPLILILLGTVLCCTGGGVLRDLMVRRPVRILNNYAEAYAETVICGCLAYMFVRRLGFHIAYRALAGWSTVVVARILATQYNYSLPQAVALRTKYKPPTYP